MSGDVKYSTCFLIWGFAAAMVALGAQELHRSLLSQRQTPKHSPQQLVEVLHGPLGFDLGRFGPEEIEALKQRRSAAARSGGLPQLLGSFSPKEETPKDK